MGGFGGKKGERGISVNILSKNKKEGMKPVVAHAFNPSTWEAEAGRFLSLRPSWSIK
jgi:major histocompatibility complex class I